MIIDSKQALREQLKKLSPHKIAVAYLGNSWSNYIDCKKLEMLIVSPQLGSQPDAIVDLANKIGWEKVWLLENLHSKLYIGNEGVLLGSANLSFNAFGDSTQEEACFYSSNAGEVSRASEIFRRYLIQAKSKFPDKKTKLVRIEELRKETGKAISHKILKNGTDKLKSFGEFDPERDGEVIATWYENGESSYTEEAKLIENDILSEVHLSPKDDKPLWQWLLSWRITKNGNVDSHASSFEWTYVQETITNGTLDDGYEMLCFQRESLEAPARPFDETEEKFRKLFKKVMDQERFKSLRLTVNKNQSWLQKDHLGLMKEFWKELSKEYKIAQ